MAFLKGLGLDISSLVEVPVSINMIINNGMTGWNPGNIVNDNPLTTGGLLAWHSDGYKVGSFFVIDLGVPRNIIKARVVGDFTNAVYTINYSDDGNTWSSASNNFSFSRMEAVEPEWVSVGAHRYWRFYINSSKEADNNTNGSWLLDFKLYEQPQVIDTTPIFMPKVSTGIMDTKIMGIPIIYAGGGLIGALILMKILFRKK